MIALILAAAVATAQPRLSPEEFHQVVLDAVEIYQAYKITHAQYTDPSSEKYIGREGEKHSSCNMQQSALSAEARLQEIADDGTILVMRDDLNLKIRGSTRAGGYKLSPDETRQVEAMVRQIDFEARQYAVDCGS